MIDPSLILWSQEIPTKEWRGVYNHEVRQAWYAFFKELSDEMVDYGYDVDVLDGGTFVLLDYIYCHEWL